MRITVRQIVVAAALSAIAILLGATRIGFIPFFVVSITIMHIPVIIGAVMEGPWVGAVIGLIFGAFSLVWAAFGPLSVQDPYFQNPLISILPRLFIGPAAYLAYRLVRNQKSWKVALLAAIALLAIVAIVVAYTTPLFQGTPTIKTAVLIAAAILVVLVGAGLYLGQAQQSELSAVGAAAVVGTLTNTVLVLGALALFGKMGGLAAIPGLALLGVGLTNGIPEIIAAVLITVAVVAAWKQIEFGRKGARIFQESK